MKQLIDYINESILNDIDNTMNDSISDELIINWIEENWLITGELNVKFDGEKYVVDCNGNLQPRTGKITNGLFVWGSVIGNFIFNILDTDIQKVKSLKDAGLPQFVGGILNLHSFTNVTNLEGLPNNVGSLYISGFKKLSSLKGCPTYVKNNFSILLCPALKGLDYLPNHIGGGITINHNKNLLSIDGLSAVTNVVNGNLFLNSNFSLKSLHGCPSIVDGDFSCEKNKSLTSLSGCPEQVKYSFSCKSCATRFKKNTVMSICQVGGEIHAYKN